MTDKEKVLSIYPKIANNEIYVDELEKVIGVSEEKAKQILDAEGLDYDERLGVEDLYNDMKTMEIFNKNREAYI